MQSVSCGHFSKQKLICDLFLGGLKAVFEIIKVRCYHLFIAIIFKKLN